MPTRSDLLYTPVRDLGRMLRTRQTTSIELTELALSRLGSTGKQLNAVARLMPERAREQALRADREITHGVDRGPLHGIPYGAKDLLDTKGVTTTWGAAPYADRVPDADATVISKLADAGAVLCAKLSMAELAGGLGYHFGDASYQGAMRNPWNPERWAGGSSSGSGASVSAGLVPFAIGTETWGSILCPSNFCGVTGLRPTFGRVSRHGAMALSWTLDKIGPIGAHARRLPHRARRHRGAGPARRRRVDGEAQLARRRSPRPARPQGRAGAAGLRQERRPRDQAAL